MSQLRALAVCSQHDRSVRRRVAVGRQAAPRGAGLNHISTSTRTCLPTGTYLPTYLPTHLPTVRAPGHALVFARATHHQHSHSLAHPPTGVRHPAITRPAQQNTAEHPPWIGAGCSSSCRRCRPFAPSLAMGTVTAVNCAFLAMLQARHSCAFDQGGRAVLPAAAISLVWQTMAGCRLLNSGGRTHKPRRGSAVLRCVALLRSRRHSASRDGPWLCDHSGELIYAHCAAASPLCPPMSHHLSLIHI